MQSIVSEFSSLWFASHWSTCLSARISTPRRGWRLGATFETHCVQCSATPWSSSTGSWRVLTQPLSVQLQVVTFKSVNHNVGTVLYKRDITKCLLWNFRRLKKGKFFSPSLWISWLPWILLGMFSMFWTAGTTRTGTLYTTRRAIYSLWKKGLDLEEKMLQENPEFEGGILS